VPWGVGSPFSNNPWHNPGGMAGSIAAQESWQTSRSLGRPWGLGDAEDFNVETTNGAPRFA